MSNQGKNAQRIPETGTLVGGLGADGNYYHMKVATGGGPAVPTGGATSAKQDTGNTSLSSLDTNLAKTIPATTAAAVTPSDATALTSRAVWVGGVGDLSVRLSGAPSTTVVFTAVPAGSLLPISVVRIMAATTATNINVLN